jgi:hypothetical protein
LRRIDTKHHSLVTHSGQSWRRAWDPRQAAVELRRARVEKHGLGGPRWVGGWCVRGGHDRRACCGCSSGIASGRGDPVSSGRCFVRCAGGAWRSGDLGKNT